jgi:hypothetical protein
MDDLKAGLLMMFIFITVYFLITIMGVATIQTRIGNLEKSIISIELKLGVGK